MRRIAPRAGAALAALACVSPMAQVLTAPLDGSPHVRLTDSCSTVENGGLALFGDPQGLHNLVSAVNDPNADPAFLRELWWPTAARVAGFQGNAAILSYGLFQDTDQIAAAMNADTGLFARGVRNAATDSFACFPTPPPPALATVRELRSAGGEFRLAVGPGEAASLIADGWVETGDTYEVLVAGTCYGGIQVFRFARAQGGPRAGNLLTLDVDECSRVRKSDPAWRPVDVAFASVAPVNGACSGTYSSISVYRLDSPPSPMVRASHRYTSSRATYDAMLSQGWAGRGVAFCAMP